MSSRQTRDFTFTAGKNSRIHYLASAGSVSSLVYFLHDLADADPALALPSLSPLDRPYTNLSTRLPDAYRPFLAWLGVGANSPLHWAIHSCSWDMVRFLVFNGSSLALPNLSGQLPLVQIWNKATAVITPDFLALATPPLASSPVDWIATLLASPPRSPTDSVRLLRLFLSLGCQPSPALLAHPESFLDARLPPADGKALLSILSHYALSASLPPAPASVQKLHL